MNITTQTTVAEVVTKNIKTADIFKKYGIDFCCGGGISIQKACEKKQVNYNTLSQELIAIENKITSTHNYDSWNLSFLIDHIRNVHHTYVVESIPVLLQYAEKVARVHGHHYVEVVAINSLFIDVAQELLAHMKKEEQILFPYIKQLVAVKDSNASAGKPHFGTVNNPIKMMEAEHENAGDIFKQISKLTNNYTPPENACNTFRALYAKLQEFEQDLHQHIHLENNILFPKSIQLEKDIIK